MNIANFSKGENYKEIYSGLWQWDYGQVLRIQGLDLPTAVEIHFSLQEKGGEAVTRVGTTKNGATDVVIPDSMLENNGSAADYFIYAFIYLIDATSGQTEYKISMKVKARPKPEAFDSPEDAELFREAIAAVNEAADRAETAEKEAEGWAHGREDMPEKAEDNAKYYSDRAAKDAEQTSADRKEVERLVESVSGIDEDVELVRGYKEAEEKAAEGAATSAQASEESRKASETAKAAAETAQKKAEEAAGKTAEDRKAVEQAKTDIEGMKNQVAEDKSSIEQTVAGFAIAAKQAVTDINNAGQSQTERVQGAGNTAVQDIQTAKEQAVQNVEAAGTQQVQAVQTEGTTQIGAVQQKGQEVLDSIPEDFTTQMAGKLDKNQGEENSGKVLVVGEDGTVTPGETPIKVDSTLTQSGQAADAKATGDTITALAIKNQESGAVPIIITDSAEYPIQDIEMEGWTEQASTTGAQLLKLDAESSPSSDKYYPGYTVTKNGLTATVLEDGGIQITGSDTTESGWNNIMFMTFISSEQYKLPPGTYTVSDCTVRTNISNKNNTFTIEEEETVVGWYISYTAGSSNVNDILYPILNSGPEALPYEPYTGGQPSPSPDYPQEIVNGGNYNEESQKWEYEVSVTGKNLLPYGEGDIKIGIPYETNGRTYVLNKDGSITITTQDQSTPTGSVFIFGSVSENKMYKLNPGVYSASTYNANINAFSIQFCDSEGKNTRTAQANGKTFKIYEGEYIKYCWLYGVAGTVWNTTIYPQIELTESTSYETYKHQSAQLTSDRPLTKWDRLEKRDGQWGWVFKSNIQKILEHASLDNSGIYVNFPRFTLPDIDNLNEKKCNYFYNLSVNTSYEFAFLMNEYVIGEFGSVQALNDFIDSANSSDNPVCVMYETKSETFTPLTESEQ